MSTQAYLTTAQEILGALRVAIHEADALLPEGVRMRHWLFAKQRPSPSAAYDDVHDWLYGQEEADEETLQVLLHLKLLTAALADLTTVTAPPPVGAPDLRLAKGRRTG